MKTITLAEKNRMIHFLIWLSAEKHFALDVKDVEKFITANEMCEMMCEDSEEEDPDAGWQEEAEKYYCDTRL